jgi:hypothetical protein
MLTAFLFEIVWNDPIQSEVAISLCGPLKGLSRSSPFSEGTREPVDSVGVGKHPRRFSDYGIYSLARLNQSRFG